MAIRVSYRKNIVSGAKKGFCYVEEQIVSSKQVAQQLCRLLMEVSDMFPARDPVTECLCYVTDIKTEESEAPEKELQTA